MKLKMKFLEEGIHYDELSDEEKKELKNTSNTDTITYEVEFQVCF